MQAPKNGEVAVPIPATAAKARQDARVHIFTAALLEHICSLYERNPFKRKKVFEGIKIVIILYFFHAQFLRNVKLYIFNAMIDN